MDRKLFKLRLQRRLPARWHMSVICLLTIAGGVLVSKLLLQMQVGIPAVRYGIAVLASYGVFFALISIWLRLYFDRPREQSETSVFDALDVLDVPNVSNLNPNPPGTTWSIGKGSFSGGGATTSWESDSVDAPLSAVSDGASIGDLDELVVVVLLAVVITLISGSAVYVVYQAPEILFEAAFEVVLAAGLFGQARRIQGEGWAYSIFKRTWIPFAVVLLAAVAFGAVIKHQCPLATSFSEYRSQCP